MMDSIVLEHLREDGPATALELARKMGRPKYLVNQTLYSMKTKQQVTIVNDENPPRWYVVESPPAAPTTPASPAAGESTDLIKPKCLIEQWELGQDIMRSINVIRHLGGVMCKQADTFVSNRDQSMNTYHTVKGIMFDSIVPDTIPETSKERLLTAGFEGLAHMYHTGYLLSVCSTMNIETKWDKWNSFYNSYGSDLAQAIARAYRVQLDELQTVVNSSKPLYSGVKKWKDLNQLFERMIEHVQQDDDGNKKNGSKRFWIVCIIPKGMNCPQHSSGLPPLELDKEHYLIRQQDAIWLDFFDINKIY